MNFLIGLEFEFGWKVSSTNYYFYKNETFLNIKQELEKTFGRNWTSNIQEFTQDGSLQFKTKKESYYGIELITKPMKESIAIKFCKDMLKWMQNNEKVCTNKTCGLHVNISILNKKIKKNQLNIDYYNLLSITPQKELLQLFGREQNKYCQISENKKFSLIINNKETNKNNLKYWLKYLKNSTIKVNSKNHNEELISVNNKKEFFKLIKKSYLDRLSQIPKRISIVEKVNNEEKYYEFRIIGNSNYEYRYKDIIKCINIFKESIKKSIQNK